MAKARLLSCLLISTLLFSCQKKDEALFTLLDSSDTKIDFVNTLKEDEQFNIIEYLYFYNGGGVAVGDINNDGLVDVYFSSNQNSNKLYLNKGNLKFQDITEASGTKGIGNWKTGVTMADVNGDGFLDIYACGVGSYKNFNSRNQLLINNGDLTFSDKSAEANLNFQGLSTQSVFFDYDLDGDLDCYLLNHSVHSSRSLGNKDQRLKPDFLAGDRLYRNDLIVDGKMTSVLHFTDVTKEAGIFSSAIGYGLGVGVADLNLDGFPDIYVSNDFQENDYLYLNNHRGAFLQVLENSIGHCSRFSMGNDIADFNNDGAPDIVTLDMLPKHEDIIKTSAGEDAYEIYKYKLQSGYHYQVSRNCLQLNRLQTDTSVLMSEIAMVAGVEATDWSWSPLLADFDQDGKKDLFITNGILRRPNDMDYISYIGDKSVQLSLQTIEKEDLKILEKMPSGKVSNFIYQNKGALRFDDVTDRWGLQRLSYSNGSAYADLDNDGDLDLVVNNLNDPAFIYRNNSRDVSSNSFLQLTLSGELANKNGLGTKVTAFAAGESFYQEVSSTRGFCSSSDTRINIGLGEHKLIDSLIVIWPDGRFQKIRSPKVNQFLKLRQKDAKGVYSFVRPKKQTLTPIDKSETPDFKHHENDFNAFNNESLIPHMLTTEGPAFTTGDVNGDGLDDIFLGGTKEQQAVLYLQSVDGKWKKSSQNDLYMTINSEDVDAAFFDADNDRDLDLVVVAGGQEKPEKKEYLKPRLYINNGRGDFIKSDTAFPNFFTNASCVRAADYDRDGDVDLFIGSNVIPLLYGMSPASFLLINDGKGHFQPDLGWLANSRFPNPTGVRPGMVKDAVWTDVNQDKSPDLILVGEWMPLTILIQNRFHQFENRTREYGLDNTRGWWNSIIATDVDHDGHDEWIVGNWGLNSRVKASIDKPLKMYLGDFDSNGSSDHILVYYNGDKCYPFASRDQLVKQLPILKKKFLKYQDYRNVILEDIITPQQQGNSAEMQVEILESIYLKGDNGKMLVSPLPVEAQLFPVYALYADDLNHDGNQDLIMAGNHLANQPDFGPDDAGYGLVLLGDGKGGWKPLPLDKSGFVVKGEARDIRKVKGANGRQSYWVSRNNESLLGFK